MDSFCQIFHLITVICHVFYLLINVKQYTQKLRSKCIYTYIYANSVHEASHGYHLLFI